MPKKTFENLPEEKRTQIQEVALDEFARQPFAQASLSKIVARLGIAKGSIYQYFDNKLDLAKWLITEAGRQKARFIDAPMSPEPGEFFDWLELALDGGMRFAARRPKIARLGQRMLRGHDPAMAGFASRARKVGLEIMVGYIKEAQLHREIRDDADPEIVAVMVGAMQNSALELLATKAGEASVEALFEHEGLAQFSDEEIAEVTHELMRFFRRGVEDPRGPKVVEGAPHHAVDLEETLKRMRGDVDERD